MSNRDNESAQASSAGHAARKDSGLESRYDVRRINDATGKHDDCRYFVLDPQHDPIAREALRQYAGDALTAGYVQLWNDIQRWLVRLDRECPLATGSGDADA